MFLLLYTLCASLKLRGFFGMYISKHTLQMQFKNMPADMNTFSWLHFSVAGGFVFLYLKQFVCNSNRFSGGMFLN